MLAYTLSRVLEAQRAVIQRDQATADTWGAKDKSSWADIATVPCAFWWEHQGSRGPSRLDVTPQSTIAQNEGGMLLPEGTDVQIGDRIDRITKPDGTTVIIQGPLHVTSLMEQGQFVELALRRP